MALHTPTQKQRKKFIYEVSICLIFKDEAAYLREWLEYHILIGVEHFYLYNNNSSDGYLEILTPYIEKNMVTLINWKIDYYQIGAYEHCYKNLVSPRWLGFIDADEFINLSVDTVSSINAFLNHYNTYPSVFVFWRIFGTSGILKEDQPKLAIEQYTSCWSHLCHVGKSFINTNYRFKNIWIHWCKAEFLDSPIFGIIDNKRFLPYMECFPKRNYKPKAYINHYWSKSRENAI